MLGDAKKPQRPSFPACQEVPEAPQTPLHTQRCRQVPKHPLVLVCWGWGSYGMKAILLDHNREMGSRNGGQRGSAVEGSPRLRSRHRDSPFPLPPPKAEGHFGFATYRDNSSVPQGLSNQTTPNFSPWGTHYVPAVPRQGYTNEGGPPETQSGGACVQVCEIETQTMLEVGG